MNELTQWRMESDTETDSFLNSLFNREVDIDTNKGKVFYCICAFKIVVNTLQNAYTKTQLMGK